MQKKKGFCIEDSRRCESVKRCTRLPQRIHKRDDEAKTNDEKADNREDKIHVSGHEKLH